MGKEERREENKIEAMNALIAAVARRVQESGGRAMLVGGCVRDALLGIPCYDIDCEVHGIERNALRALLREFGEIDESGEAYGIFTIRGAGLDIALPRIERRTGPGHKDFVVKTDPYLSMEQSAARRDFTVNAIMRDALTGEYADPYGGMEDLQRGILRAVPGGQFEEDPLRVLRGAQFAARFDLWPDEHTISLMRNMPLAHLSASRVEAEMKKALMQAKKPSVFFEVLRACGQLHTWMPELENLIGVRQNPKYHPEGDAWTHTMMTLDRAAEERDAQETPYAFMLAALVHDLGKAESMRLDEDGVYRAAGHEQTGVPLAGSMLSRLALGKSVIAYAQELCLFHMDVHKCYYLRENQTKVNLMLDSVQDPFALIRLVVCDARGTGKPAEYADEEERFLMERYQGYLRDIKKEMPSAADMMALGVLPGRALGGAMKRARQLVLMGHDAKEAARLAAGEYTET